MNIKPLRDKIIVKPEQRFKSEVLDLSKVEGYPTTGHVVALGDEAERQGLKMGDKVHFGTVANTAKDEYLKFCLLYTSPSPRDLSTSRMPSSA